VIASYLVDIVFSVFEHTASLLNLPPKFFLSFMFASVLSSQMEIPIKRQHPMVTINVGGAVLPLLLASYLTLTFSLFPYCIAAVGVVSTVGFLISQRTKEGIKLPALALPATATIVSLFFFKQCNCVALAYVAGVIGAIVGVDLLNIPFMFMKLEKQHVLSIGGKGTFDGIFVTGVVALIMATLLHYIFGGLK